MAANSRAVSVGTTATRLDATSADFQYGAQGCAVYNDGAATIYVGGPNVTTSGATKGGPVAAGQWLSVDLAAGDELYGIVTSGTVDAIVVETGV